MTPSDRDAVIDLFGTNGVVSRAAPGSPRPAAATEAVSGPRARLDEADSAPTAADAEVRAAGPWSGWSGADRVASHRYPIELLERLNERARRLDLPVGLTVAAALAHLLEQDDDRVVELVTRAAKAKPRTLRARRR